MPIFQGWFTSRAVPPPPRGTPVAAARVNNTGTLVSAESLKTFPVVTGAVIAVWGGTESALGWAHGNLLGLSISLAACGALLADDLLDPKRSPKPRVPMRSSPRS